MTYKIICPVINNQVVVNLPPDFQDQEQVTVFIEDGTDDRLKKLEEFRKAANDPLFLADIREIQEDFGAIDHETL